MVKLFILSALLSMIAFPILAARSRHPMQGLKRAIVAVFLFNCVYLAVSFTADVVLGFSRGEIPPALITHWPTR